MSTINELFQQAQLAEAAYANFINPDTGAIYDTEAGILATLIASGFSSDPSNPTQSAQASAFVAQWRVVDQYTASGGLLGDGSGFSGTLFQNIATGEYTFSLRGTEPGATDLSADIGDILVDGLALDQIVDMYNYWQSLTHTGVYQAAKLETSLIETAALNLLLPGAVRDAYIAVLRQGGAIIDVGLLGTEVRYVTTDNSSDTLLTGTQLALGSGELAATASVNVDGHSMGGHLAMAFSRLFPSNTADVVAVNGAGFDYADPNVNTLFSELGGVPGFDAGKITNVVGSAAMNLVSQDWLFLQQPAGRQEIYTESYDPVSTTFGHGSSQMTDSLAVYNLFAQLDPTLDTNTNGLQTITDILKAESGVAANSLESAMTDLGKLFNVPSAVVTGNAFDGAGRDQLYTAIAGFDSIVNAPFAVVPSIQSLVGMDAATLAASAKTDIAYRYALQQLNPFVAVGMDYSTHNTAGELDLYSAATHSGSLTDQYLTDRAAFLINKVLANTSDNYINGAGYVQSNGALLHFQDDSSVIPTQVFVAPANIGYTNDDFQHIRFGSAQSDTLTGYAKDDQLYGGAGDDILTGGGGNDYLEGGAGVDIYAWKAGEGIDTILDTDSTGYLRDDTSSPIVITDGGQYGDNRVFRGADANGQSHLYTFITGNSTTGGDLLVDGTMLVLNYNPALGNHMGITLTGPVAVINPITTRDIEGDLKPIETLVTVAVGGTIDPVYLDTTKWKYVSMVSDGATEVWTFYELNDLGNVITDEGVAAPGLNNILNGSSGNDHIMSGGGSDHINATQGGNDLIESGTERDFVEAGNGNNVIMGGAAGDILISGNGNDFLYADTQVDVATAIAQGNAQTGTGLQGDWLTATGGDDTLIGSNGNDVLMGGAGSDLLIGGAGDDDIVGDGGFIVHEFGWSVYSTSTARVFEAFPFGDPITGEWASAGGAADVIYAGEGNDHAWGGTGNDVIFGESGNDILIGDSGDGGLFGNDYLDGGSEDDTLYGEAGEDILIGGAGADTLYGGAGQDIYIFNRGDGGDTVYDSKADHNIFRFGAGITSSDITLRLGSLMLDLGNGDEIHINNTNQANANGFDRNDVFNSSSISSFEFDDGTVLSTAELLARGFDLKGTSGDDVTTATIDPVTGAVTITDHALYGTNTTDRINGLGGNDQLYGMAGDDTLNGGDGNDQLVGDDGTSLTSGNDILNGGAGDDSLWGNGGDDILNGGTGNDTLIGGTGSDIYLLNLGPSTGSGQAGQDTILDTPEIAGNAIQFGADITAGNTQFLRQGADLLIKYGTQGDTVTIQNFAPSGAAGDQAITQFQFADGSAGSYTADGLGNAHMNALDASGLVAGDFWQTPGGYGNDTYSYNAQGIKTGDSWTKSDGSFGADVYNADGSSSGTRFYINGTSSKYTNDGLGNTMETTYRDYSQLIKIGDSWTKSDGSHGNDVFSADGSSLGSAYAAPGTNVPHSTYTIDSYGNKEAINYDAAGNITSDIWTFANGNYRNESFNSDGSSSGATYHPDGSYSAFTNDGQGQVITKNYGWDGTLTGSNIAETNGLHNVITSYDSPAGVKLSESWIHSDGSSGSDLVSALDYNGALNLMTQVSSAYPDYSVGTYSYVPWTTPDGASGYFYGDNSYGELSYENGFRFPAPSGSTWGTDGGNYVYLNSDGSPSYIDSEMWLPNDSYIWYEARPVSVYWGNIQVNGVATVDFWTNNDVDFHGIMGADGAKYIDASAYYYGMWHTTLQRVATPQSTMTVTMQGANGSYSIFRDDGQGNMEVVSYDANGVKLDEMWLHNDGSHGVDTFNADGSITGQSVNPDGTVSSYRDDGQGHVVETNYRGVQATLQNVPLQIAPQPEITPPPPPSSLSVSPGTGYSRQTSYMTTVPDNQGGTYVYQWGSNGSVNIVHVGAQGNVLSGGFVQTDPGFGANATIDGKNTGWTYDVAGVPTSSYGEDGPSTGSGGNVITYFYDAQGHVTRSSVATTDNQGGITTNFYDAAGQLTGTSTRLATTPGQVTTTNYDAAGQLTGSSLEVTDGLSNTVTSSYDAAGVLLSFSTMIVTSTGAVEITAYDAHGVATGVIVTSTDSLGVISTSTFDASGKYTGSVIATPDSSGYFATSDYDATGTLTFYVTLTSNAQHDTIFTTYDAQGIKIRDNTLQATGVEVSNIYQQDGSIVSTSHNPDGSFSISANDGMGNVTVTHYSVQEVKFGDTWTRADGSSGTDTFNADGTVSCTATYADGTSSTSVNNGQGQITTQHYGADGITLTGTTTFTNTQGNLLTITCDANGNKISGSWTKADGSYGKDFFNIDGTSIGTSINPDGSYSNYFDDGHGTTITNNYDASGNNIAGIGGNDILIGGQGADILIGGAGNDSYYVDNADDIVTENANEGADTVYSGITYTLAGNVENLTLTGAAAINGTGNALDNVIVGNPGNNVINGDLGADSMSGGAGNDTYVVDVAGDIITENANEGTDTVQSGITYTLAGNFENLTLTGTANLNGTGNAADNIINGNTGNNILTGLAGNDTLNGGAGADTMRGGVGDDTYVVDTASDIVTENANEGADLVQSSITYTLASNVENLTLTGTSNLNGTGNAFNNVIAGNTGNNILSGLAGNDTLTGNTGNDTLDGGIDADTMAGGVGNDTYVVDTAGDIVTENANEGTDTVQSGITYTLSSNVENLTLTGTGAINGTGNAVDNFITGNSGTNLLTGLEGNDTLNGGIGADTMLGGVGNDTYVVDNVGDIVTENANEGTDIVQSSVTYTLASTIENLTLTGTAAINGTGNALDNIITGNSGANLLAGLEGNDTYVVNTGDIVTENANEGTDTVQSASSYTLASNVENLTLTGAANFNGTGNALDNIITGNASGNQLVGLAGNDTLNGGTGADTMLGGVGDDTYVVDNASDIVTENADEGTDTVQSGISYTLAGNVENLTLTGAAAINGTGNTLDNVIAGNTSNNIINGGLGADSMSGGAGNDTYVVDNAGDIVKENANEGTDLVQSSITYTLIGNIENFTLTGTAAINGTGNVLDNIITGNTANNILSGLEGNDTYVVNNAGNIVTENANEGTDLVKSSITYTLTDNVENLTLIGAAAINGTGNALDNVIVGNDSDNILSGLAGNDTLTGNTGNDTLDGGLGIDSMAGGAWNDTYVVDNVGDMVTEALNAGTDTVQSSITYTLVLNVENLTLTGTASINGTGNTLNNVITGNEAANLLTGLEGNDTLDGGAGVDTMLGGVGNDTYVVDNASDIVTENTNEGIDTVQSGFDYTLALAGNVENLTLTGTTAINGTGNALDNVITGNTSNNVLSGLEGNDTLNGGAGADAMLGGIGNDIYVVDDVGDIVTENADEGNDTVQSAITYTLASTVENLTLTGTLNGAPSINGTGNALDNYILGNSGNNILIGLEGNDTLDGSYLADTMLGGMGDDIYVVDYVLDIVTENANEGSDLVLSSISYTLTDNLENLTLTGTGNRNGTGNALDNVIIGNSGYNIIDGGLGADTMIGGSGYLDRYVVDNVGDVVIEELNGGIDVVESSVSYTLGDNLEGLVLTGSDAINATGNTLNNSLSGNSGSNLIDGGAGADSMSGGAGDDTYVIDNVGDTVIEAAIAGNDAVIASVSCTLANNIENLNLSGMANINGTGNALDNLIVGNSGNNSLTGMEGNDTLDGGLGADTLAGGVGNDSYVVDNVADVVVEAVNAGIDTVQSSVSYTLSDNVETLKLTGIAGINATGNALDNTLTGNNGVNALDGGDGADTLIGGQGNDTLLGGAGNDRYVFNLGDGSDTIVDMQGSDTLYIGGNLTEADLEGARDGDNMIVKVLGTTDTITLVDWFVQGEGVNRIEFGDGSLLDHAGIEGLMNRPPVANPDTITVYEDGGMMNVPTALLLANDTDPNTNDVLTVQSVGASALGADVSLVNGQVQYDIGNRYQELGAGQTIADSFGYTISDSKGATASSVVNVTITGTNDAPVTATPIAAQQTDEDVPFSFTIPAATFTDIDTGDVLNYIATLADGGALPSWLTFDDTTQTFSGTALNTDVGNLSVRVTATDSGGLSASSTFALDVINVNDTPTANDDTGAAVEDGGAVLLTAEALMANDTDPDTIHGDVMHIAGVSQAASGAVVSLVNGNVQYNIGTLFQSLAQGQSATDTFSYTVSDTAGATSTATVTMTITGVNDGPVTVDDAANVQEDFTLTAIGNVLTNDSDVDQGSVLTVANAGTLQGNYGSLVLNADGSYSYALDNASLAVQSLATGQVVTESFGYQATDGLISTPSNLTITITGTNDAPLLVNALPDQNMHTGSVYSYSNYTNCLDAINAFGDFVSELSNQNTAFNYQVPSDAFADIDSGDSLTYSATLSNGTALPSWLAFDPLSRTFSGTPTIGSPSILDIQVIASDIAGATASDIFRLSLGATINGGDNFDILVGTSFDDTLNGGLSWDLMVGGSGNDIYVVDNAYDVVIEFANDGIDTVRSMVTYTLGDNLENLTLTGASAINGTGNTLDNVLVGNSAINTLTGGTGNDLLNGGLGNDILKGDAGNDVLEGADGNDALSDSDGNNLFNGAAGADTLTGNSGNELFICGTGNDTITTGSGADIIAFNRGDGQDTVVAGSGQAGTTDNTISLGGGIGYQSLAMSKSGKNLILDTGNGDTITLQDWFTKTANRSVVNLQIVLDNMTYNPASLDTLVNRQVQRFDFAALANDFDQALAADPTLVAWSMADALLTTHLAGSDTEALGGDLAYQFNLNGSLAGIGVASAQAVLGDANFGVAPQLLQPLASLQTGAARLG